MMGRARTVSRKPRLTHTHTHMQYNPLHTQYAIIPSVIVIVFFFKHNYEHCCLRTYDKTPSLMFVVEGDTDDIVADDYDDDMM